MNLTEDQVYERIAQAIQRVGSQKAFADLCKLAPAYINDIVRKRRAIPDRVCEVLGIERIVTVTYRAKEESASESVGTAEQC